MAKCSTASFRTNFTTGGGTTLATGAATTGGTALTTGAAASGATGAGTGAGAGGGRITGTGAGAGTGAGTIRGLPPQRKPRVANPMISVQDVWAPIRTARASNPNTTCSVEKLWIPRPAWRFNLVAASGTMGEPRRVAPNPARR